MNADKRGFIKHTAAKIRRFGRSKLRFFDFPSLRGGRLAPLLTALPGVAISNTDWEKALTDEM